MSNLNFNLDRTSYSKPPKNSYSKENNKNQYFKINRQPMGKSSYQCDFLEYGALPTYDFKH